ncbi:MAG: hypothetical protein ACR2OI_08110 [Acidimicrobiia bacterium]
MREPDWAQSGATIPTLLATLTSLLAAPIAGIGLISALFGAWMVAVTFTVAALILWFGGKWLLDR